MDYQPLPTVHGPHANAVGRLDAEFRHPVRQTIRRIQQLRPCEPLPLVARHYRQLIRETLGVELHLLTDGAVEQRNFRSS
jgi:hypothetical protein